MLPRDQRLRAHRDFQRVYRAGKSWAHPLVALHVVPGESGQRIGISASKKVGKAVVRNRARRRLREVVRALLPEWKHGFDAVLVVRTAAAEAEFAALHAAVAELARRARLTREPGAAPDTPFIMPAGGKPPRAVGAGKNARAEQAAERSPQAG